MSLIATAVKHLIAAGVSGDDLVRAIADMEAQQVAVAAPVLTARQARNRRYYDKTKASEKRLNASEQDVSDVVTPPPSPSPLSSPPTPPPIIPQSPSTTPETKRATRLAGDWQLPAAWGRWAIDQGHSDATIRLEADKFRDFWIGKSGKDATKLDWEATWRNWMRNAGRPRGNSQAPPSGTGNAMVDRLDELMNGMGQRNADERRTIEGSNEHGAYDRAPQAVLGPAASQGRR